METCGWEGARSTPNAPPGGAAGAHSVPQQVGTWGVTAVQPTFLISLWTLATAGLTQNLLHDGVPPPRGAAGQGRGSQVSLPRAGTRGLQVAGARAAVGGAVGGDTVETRSPVQVGLGAETSLAWEAAPLPQAGTLQQAETLEPSLPGRRASLSPLPDHQHLPQESLGGRLPWALPWARPSVTPWPAHTLIHSSRRICLQSTQNVLVGLG